MADKVEIVERWRGLYSKATARSPITLEYGRAWIRNLIEELSRAESSLAAVTAERDAALRERGRDSVAVPKALLQRLCQMVYITRGEQLRLAFINSEEYGHLVRLRHSKVGPVEAVLTALSAPESAQEEK